MITIQARSTVDEHGVATLRVPSGIIPGEHEVVVVIGEAPPSGKTPIRVGLPRHDVGIIPPEHSTLRDWTGDLEQKIAKSTKQMIGLNEAAVNQSWTPAFLRFLRDLLFESGR